MAGVVFKTVTVGLQPSLLDSGSASKESLLEAFINLNDDARRASKVWPEQSEEFLAVRMQAVSLYLRTNNSIRTQGQVDALRDEYDDLRSHFKTLATAAASAKAQHAILPSFDESSEYFNNASQHGMEPSCAESVVLNNRDQGSWQERDEAVEGESGVVVRGAAFGRSGSSDSSRRASTGSMSWCASGKAAVQAAPKRRIFHSVADMKQEIERKTSRRSSWPPATHTPTDVPEIAKGSHVVDRVKSFEEKRHAARSTPSPVKTVEVVPEHQHVAELVQVLAACHRDEQMVWRAAEDMPLVRVGQHIQDRVKMFGGGVPRCQRSATPSPPPPPLEALSPPASEQQEQEPREVHAPSSAAAEPHRKHHEAKREVDPAAPSETTTPTPPSSGVSSPQTVVVAEGPVILASEAGDAPMIKPVRRVLLVESPVHTRGSKGMVEEAVSQQPSVEDHHEAEAEKTDSPPTEKAGSTAGGWLGGVSWRSAALAATVIGTGVVVLLAVKGRRRR